MIRAVIRAVIRFVQMFEVITFDRWTETLANMEQARVGAGLLPRARLRSSLDSLHLELDSFPRSQICSYHDLLIPVLQSPFPPLLSCSPSVVRCACCLSVVV